MQYKVAALYQFTPLPDFRDLRGSLRELCASLDIKGTLLLAGEGINGTIAGAPDAVDALIAQLRDGELFGGRLSNLELKFSSADAPPFKRMKVRMKKEIVTIGDIALDPAAKAGTYVDARDWNALLDAPDVTVIDIRNAFEVALGTFDGALDPKLNRFGEFPEYAARALDPGKHRKIAMFCTGGIRCEKASAYLLAQGYAEVYHLKGGILKYLEEIPEAQSRWTGQCFVFDERVALSHGLALRAPVKEAAE